MKILIIAFVVGVAIMLAFRSCHRSAPKGKEQASGGFFGAFHKAAEGAAPRLGAVKDKKPKGPYDVYSEKLRAECGPYFIRTDGGQYELGRMSNKGFVVAIQDRVIRVIQPDGKSGFVVCDDSASFLPADASANQKSVVGSDIAKGTPAEDRRSLFRTSAASDGGLSPAPLTVASSSKPSGSRAADWAPSAVPGW